MRLRPTFPGMVPGEKVVLLLHRHWVFGLRLILAHFVFIIPPLAAWWVLGRYSTVLVDGTSAAYAFTILLFGVYALFWALAFFIAWLNFYLDTWIITNERIINIEQLRLFYRTVSEQKLFRVQDVTTDVHGFFAGMFRYGNVSIQTAAEKERFVFEQVPHPEEVAKTIMHLLESIESQIGLDAMAKIEGDIPPPPPTTRSQPPTTPPAPKAPTGLAG